MKKLIIFSLLAILVILPSCNREINKELLPELVEAERLMYDHPDSALQVLERMQMPSPSNRYQYATWCLFTTQALDKNYRKHTSDSLIRIAYAYFAEQDDPQRKALAANYQGRINEDLGEVEKATQYYLEAISEVEKTKDYRLAYFIHSNLGMLYLYRSLSEYAANPLQKAYEYAKLSGNTGDVSSSLSYIARSYAVQSNWDKAIEYYTEALQVAKTVPDMREYSTALGELADIYSRVNKYELALRYAHESLSIKEKECISLDQTMLIVGDIYRCMGKSDSANYYLQKAILSDNIRTVRDAFLTLYFLSKEEKDYKEAIEYNEKYWMYSDSIQKIARSKEIIEMQEKYDKAKLLNEKNQLQIDKDDTVRSGLLILVFLICIIAASITIYQRKLIRKEHTIQENEEQIRLYALKIHQNESLINENKSRMMELTSQIEKNLGMQEQLEEQQNALLEMQVQNETMCRENLELQSIVDQTSVSLQAKEMDAMKELSDENRHLRAREKFLCDKLVGKMEMLDSLKKSPRYLETHELFVIREAVNEVYNNFSVRLSGQIPLSEDDISLCCLIKLRLTNTEIGTMLNITADSVSKRKQRIKAYMIKELGMDFGNKRTLDLWILEY